MIYNAVCADASVDLTDFRSVTITMAGDCSHRPILLMNVTGTAGPSLWGSHIKKTHLFKREPVCFTTITVPQCSAVDQATPISAPAGALRQGRSDRFDSSVYSTHLWKILL
jgi:hypothetical protein